MAKDDQNQKITKTDVSEIKKISEELFKKILPEQTITQEIRQQSYENFTTTDDHLMHIVGLGYDQNKNKYYKTKNSWGAESNSYGGFLYMSESYIKLKTIAIMIHKDALPEDIKTKLKL